MPPDACPSQTPNNEQTNDVHIRVLLNRVTN